MGPVGFGCFGHLGHLLDQQGVYLGVGLTILQNGVAMDVLVIEGDFAEGVFQDEVHWPQ